MKQAGVVVVLLAVALGALLVALLRESRSGNLARTRGPEDIAISSGSALVLTGEAVRSPVASSKTARPADGNAASPPRLESSMIVRDEPGIQHMLHVLDATGRDLDPVFLYELSLTERGSTHDTQHPGPLANERGHEVGPSPVRIGAREGDCLSPRVFYAKSPGYAWGRIVLVSSSPETTLMLEPVGELELFVERQGEPWAAGAEIGV